MSGGLDYIRRYLTRFNPAKLSEIIVHVPTSASSLRSAFGARSKAVPPPRRSRTGWELRVTLTGPPPYEQLYDLPPLYRQPDGTWKPAASAPYARRWPDSVLEGLSAIHLANTTAFVADQWCADYAKPNGDRLVAVRRAKDSEWITAVGTITLDAHEAIVWHVAYGAFWWLRKTRQIPGRATAHAAANFANTRVATFRREQSRLRRVEEEAASAARYAKAGTSMFPGRGRGPFPGGTQ